MGQVVSIATQGKPATQPVARKRPTLLRSRLVAACNSTTLIQAPAGFGKSVLLEQLRDINSASGAQTIDIVLDENDRDPTVLNLRFAGVRHAATDRSTLVTVDNLERIWGSAGETALMRLIETLSPLVRVVMATRRYPEAGATRLRLSAGLDLVKADQLRFTPEEFVEFMGAECGVKLADAAAFVRTSDGWPAAVGMIAMEMRDARHAHDLLAFDPANWPILRHYVDEEIVAPLAPDLAAFVDCTAPLGRFTLPLAIAVSGLDDADDIVHELETIGILSREEHSHQSSQQWFRYIPLIGACRERNLESVDPARLRSIHQRAMDWHRRSGRLSDAIRHAFAAGDAIVAADLLEAASRERRRLGRISADASWSEHIGNEGFARHPRLHVEAACSFATRFEIAAARAHLATAREYFTQLEPVIRDDLYAVDAMMAVYGDRPEACVEIAERGLRDREGDDPYTAGTLRLIAASGWIARSDLDRARTLSVQALADNKRAGSAFGIAIALTLHGLADAVSGDLSAALRCWLEGEDAIRDESGIAGIDKIAIGYLPALYYERNQLDLADQCLDRCLSGPLGIVLPDMLTSILTTASRVATVAGRGPDAADLLHRGVSIATANGWPRLTHAMKWEEIRNAVMAGKEGEARRLRAALTHDSAFEELPGILTPALECEANLVGELRFQAAFEPSPAVISRLRSASNQALATNRRQRAVKLLVLEAICRDVLGDRSAAMRTMRRALELGSVGGMIRSIVDEGARAIALVQGLREVIDPRDPALGLDYVDAVLRDNGTARPCLSDDPVVLEPLSTRETEILRLVFNGHSNADVARRAMISENTVKWHLQNVYSKLSVSNRTGAVAAARSLGLFDQPQAERSASR